MINQMKKSIRILFVILKLMKILKAAKTMTLFKKAKRITYIIQKVMKILKVM